MFSSVPHFVRSPSTRVHRFGTHAFLSGCTINKSFIVYGAVHRYLPLLFSLADSERHVVQMILRIALSSTTPQGRYFRPALECPPPASTEIPGGYIYYLTVPTADPMFAITHDMSTPLPPSPLPRELPHLS